MPDRERRLEELGLELPHPPTPLGAYVRAVRTGDLLFLSGMLPVRDGVPLYRGVIGSTLSLAEGQQAARAAILNALSAICAELGSLGQVRQIVRMSVYQRTTPEFNSHAQVADAASELLRDIFGQASAHARLVFGVVSLPGGMPIEIELVIEALPLPVIARGGSVADGQ